MNKAASPLHILQVNTQDQGGGAAQVARNLFHAYQERGIDSALAVGLRRTNDPHVFLIPKENSDSLWARTCLALAEFLEVGVGKIRGIGRLRRFLHNAAAGKDALAHWRGMEEFHFPGSHRILSLSAQRPTLVHAHNLHGDYFDLRYLAELSSTVPVVLTLHDAWMLSGNCAHSLGCERWKTGCGKCPDITINPGLVRDTTALNWQRKRRIYQDSSLYVATPSQWLMDKVQQSILAPSIIASRVIPNGVDTAIFKPGDSKAARIALGLDPYRSIALFAANGMHHNPFKDVAMLRHALQALAQIYSAPLDIIALGEDGKIERMGAIAIHYVAHIASVEQVALYYQAADLYVHPAREDTFPNTILEAMACGLPVIATKVGGIGEQVRDGITGFLVAPGDALEMAQKMHTLLIDIPLRRVMGEAARQRVLDHFTLDAQVRHYLEWYTQILN